MRRTVLAASLAVFAFALLTSAKRHVSAPPLKIGAINEQRSMLITDQVILQNFTLQRVLNQLVARSGVTGLTGGQLYQQMLDTQNPKPGLFEAGAPHCDDFHTNGQPSFNGLPRRCPTAEAALAAAPFGPTDYIPLAIVNRFDMAPADGSNCGQYRLVFARQATAPTDKLHFIFEATLPNPHPERGLGGCRDAALFWASLTTNNSAVDRRDQLEQFFFDGIAGYAPAIDPANFDGSANQSGVRALEFGGEPNRPRFYQFRLTKNCNGGACTLRMMTDVLEDAPPATYFDGNNTSDVARASRDSFVSQVASLTIDDANLFQMHLPTNYLMADSDAVEGDPLSMYANVGFDRGLNTPDGVAFKARIDAELQRIGSHLTAEQVVVRAVMRSCKGCHAGVASPVAAASGDPVLSHFPANNDPQAFLTMVDEGRLQNGPDGSRFGVAQMIETTFVPHRIEILRNFLNDNIPPVHAN